MLILDKLITMTIEEVLMYPSVQAKIWGNIGMYILCLFNLIYSDVCLVCCPVIGLFV